MKKKNNDMKFNKKNNELQDIFVSTVVVLRSESKGSDEYISKVFNILNSNYTNYEIVIVDNGASFRSLI